MQIGSNSKFENLLFSIYFLNKRISFNIPWKLLKFGMCIHEGHSEGSVSQHFDLGPSFHFMKFRK